LSKQTLSLSGSLLQLCAKLEIWKYQGARATPSIAEIEFRTISGGPIEQDRARHSASPTIPQISRRAPLTMTAPHSERRPASRRLFRRLAMNSRTAERLFRWRSRHVTMAITLRSRLRIHNPVFSGRDHLDNGKTVANETWTEGGNQTLFNTVMAVT